MPPNGWLFGMVHYWVDGFMKTTFWHHKWTWHLQCPRNDVRSMKLRHAATFGKIEVAMMLIRMTERMNEWMNVMECDGMWWNVMECDGMEWNGMEWMNEWMNEWTNNINNINNIKSISSSSRALDERSSLFYFYPPAQQVELAWNKLSWNLPMPRGGNSGKYHQVWTNLNAPCSISIVLHVIGFLGFFTCFTTFFQRCSGVFLSNHPRRFYSDF